MTSCSSDSRRGQLRASPFAAALLLTSLLAGCGGSADNAAPGGGGPPGGGRGPGGFGGRAEEAVAVQVAPVTRGAISATLSFNSTLETESTVDLFPQISGQVRALLVEEGDVITTGQPLLQIDERELRVDADEARVNLEREQSNFARTEELFKRGLVNQQEFENARHTLEQRRLAADRATIRLDYATVRAPFDGVISAREVQVGARVGTGAKLFSIVSLQDMVARVFVPGRYLTAVNADQAATITSDFLPDRELAGWVKRISPVIDPQSGTFKVTVGVREPQPDVLPGLFVRVNIVTEERANALLISKRAVVYDGGEQFLFTVSNGKAVRRRLDAGFETPTTIEIRSGFADGDPIVILGQSGLKEGTPVNIVDPTTPAAPAERTAPSPPASRGSPPTS